MLLHCERVGSETQVPLVPDTCRESSVSLSEPAAMETDSSSSASEMVSTDYAPLHEKSRNSIMQYNRKRREKKERMKELNQRAVESCRRKREEERMAREHQETIEDHSSYEAVQPEPAITRGSLRHRPSRQVVIKPDVISKSDDSEMISTDYAALHEKKRDNMLRCFRKQCEKRERMKELNKRSVGSCRRKREEERMAQAHRDTVEDHTSYEAVQPEPTITDSGLCHVASQQVVIKPETISKSDDWQLDDCFSGDQKNTDWTGDEMGTASMEATLTDSLLQPCEEESKLNAGMEVGRMDHQTHSNESTGSPHKPCLNDFVDHDDMDELRLLTDDGIDILNDGSITDGSVTLMIEDIFSTDEVSRNHEYEETANYVVPDTRKNVLVIAPQQDECSLPTSDSPSEMKMETGRGSDVKTNYVHCNGQSEEVLSVKKKECLLVTMPGHHDGKQVVYAFPSRKTAAEFIKLQTLSSKEVCPVSTGASTSQAGATCSQLKSDLVSIASPVITNATTVTTLGKPQRASSEITSISSKSAGLNDDVASSCHKHHQEKREDAGDDAYESEVSNPDIQTGHLMLNCDEGRCPQNIEQLTSSDSRQSVKQDQPLHDSGEQMAASDCLNYLTNEKSATSDNPNYLTTSESLSEVKAETDRLSDVNMRHIHPDNEFKEAIGLIKKKECIMVAMHEHIDRKRVVYAFPSRTIATKYIEQQSEPSAVACPVNTEMSTSQAEATCNQPKSECVSVESPERNGGTTVITLGKARTASSKITSIAGEFVGLNDDVASSCRMHHQEMKDAGDDVKADESELNKSDIQQCHSDVGHSLQNTVQLNSSRSLNDRQSVEQDQRHLVSNEREAMPDTQMREFRVSVASSTTKVVEDAAVTRNLRISADTLNHVTSEGQNYLHEEVLFTGHGQNHLDDGQSVSSHCQKQRDGKLSVSCGDVPSKPSFHDARQIKINDVSKNTQFPLENLPVPTIRGNKKVYIFTSEKQAEEFLINQESLLVFKKNAEVCHSKEETFQCANCPQVFTSWSDVLAHDADRHAPRPKQLCSFCGLMFANIKHHEKRHKRFYCRQCTHSFVCKKYLEKHKQEVHSVGDNAEECSSCKKQFASKHALETHQRLVHQTLFYCELCGSSRRYASKHGLDIHHRQVHERLQDFECPWEGCTKMFKSANKWKQHMNIHTQTKPFKCPYCDYSAVQYNSVTWHVKSKHPGSEWPLPSSRKKKNQVSSPE